MPHSRRPAFPRPASLLTDDERQRFAALVRQHGLGTLVAELRSLSAKPRSRGRDMIDDEARLVAMAHHLEDEDLRQRMSDGDTGVLADAARRAIRDHPRSSDLTQTGAVALRAVKRLTRKFDYFCLDLGDQRGLDRGRWR
jgi:hypothetical protein